MLIAYATFFREKYFIAMEDFLKDCRENGLEKLGNKGARDKLEKMLANHNRTRKL